MADYGYDISTYPRGLDPTFTLISGPRVLIEQIARMFETAEGTNDDDPEYAMLLAETINAPQDRASLRRLVGKMTAKIQLDERVERATVSAEFVQATRRLRIAVELFPVEGKAFRFVLGIDQVTVQILEGLTLCRSRWPI